MLTKRMFLLKSWASEGLQQSTSYTQFKAKFFLKAFSNQADISYVLGSKIFDTGTANLSMFK